MAAEEARQVEVAPQALSGFLFTLNASKKQAPKFFGACVGEKQINSIHQFPRRSLPLRQSGLLENLDNQNSIHEARHRNP